MVKKIFLVRHAEAEFPIGDKRDFERRLTRNGVNQATILGQHLNELDDDIDVIFHSPAMRTLQTSKYIFEELNHTPRLVEAEELYEATLNVLKAFVSRIDDEFNTVMLVGHNPSLMELYAHLLMDLKDFSPATSSLIEFPFENWWMVTADSGSELDYYYPGMIR